MADDVGARSGFVIDVGGDFGEGGAVARGLVKDAVVKLSKNRYTVPVFRSGYFEVALLSPHFRREL